MTRRGWLAAIFGAGTIGFSMECRQIAEKIIKDDEGLKLKPYPDARDTIAIGYGRNLSLRGISTFEAEVLLGNDLDIAYETVRSIASPRAFEQLGPARVAALMSMAHQLGPSGLRSFRRMWAAIERGDWRHAAHEARDSTWARQTPVRAVRTAAILESGIVGAESYA